MGHVYTSGLFQTESIPTGKASPPVSLTPSIFIYITVIRHKSRFVKFQSSITYWNRRSAGFFGVAYGGPWPLARSCTSGKPHIARPGAAAFPNGAVRSERPLVA